MHSHESFRADIVIAVPEDPEAEDSPSKAMLEFLKSTETVRW